ncbi:Hypothetical predicted protein [Paramuricea clavata]|uniref:Uncharacterized protein n=1 Tax=Paramuricea clavata TaxID=317549 RepID=A0A7D9L652_PARCT|nr:Hypothetical predicted protein [Paramuricea clavata]
MTGLTNNVQQWDLFAMHVANVTTAPKYVDRSPQKDFQIADDNDNSKAKTQETHNNQQSTSGERNRRDRKMPENKNVNNRDRSPSTESSTSSDSDLVNRLKIHRTTGDETTLSCVVYINGHKMLVEPDTGADSNIVDEITTSRVENQVTRDTTIRVESKAKYAEREATSQRRMHCDH